MSVRMRQFVERQIITQAVKDLIAAGYSLSVDDGGDEDAIKPTQESATVLGALFGTDGETILAFKDGKQAAVWLVYGNDGHDVISDYNTSLESALTNANALADYWGGDGQFTDPPIVS